MLMTLLLGVASLIINWDFNVILKNYCSISGALINKSKSVVYGWNIDHRSLNKIAHYLGFLGFEKWEKIKYLGLPSTLGPNPPSLWLDVIGKIKSKIVSRGGHWLTRVGKLILIKFVLSSLPIF